MARLNKWSEKKMSWVVRFHSIYLMAGAVFLCVDWFMKIDCFENILHANAASNEHRLNWLHDSTENKICIIFIWFFEFEHLHVTWIVCVFLLRHLFPPFLSKRPNFTMFDWYHNHNTLINSHQNLTRLNVSHWSKWDALSIYYRFLRINLQNKQIEDTKCWLF